MCIVSSYHVIGLPLICVARNYIFGLILEMLWSKTGYFGLLGNKHSFYIILLYLIERLRYIGLKQLIWEDPTVAMVSVR